MTGGIRWLQPGAIGWDYSDARPTVQELLDNKVQFVSRYIARINDLTQPKLVSLDEIRYLADAGIYMMINLETNPDDPLKGTTRGIQDGALIGDWQTKLGWPDILPIIASLDVSITLDQINGVCTDYWTALRQTYSTGLVGDYHGVVLHKRLQSLGLSDLFWSAGDAWSWSSPYPPWAPPTHILQSGGKPGYDYNKALQPIPVWDYNMNTKDDKVFRHNASGAVWQFDKGYKTLLTGDYFYGCLQGVLYPSVPGITGVISYPASDDALSKVPDAPPVNGNNAPTHFDITLTGSANA